MRVTAAFLFLLLDSLSILLMATIFLVCTYAILVFSLPLPAYSTTELCSERLVHKNCHLLTLSCLPVPRHLICMQLLELLWLLNFAIVKSKTNHSVLHCHSTIVKIILEQRSIVKTHSLLPQWIYPLLCCLWLRGKI